MLQIVKLLPLLLLIWTAYSSQIEFLDLKLEDLNIQHIKKMVLSFSLETEISSSDYLKILFPEILHSSVTTEFIVNEIKGYYWEKLKTGSSVKYPVRVFKLFFNF